MKLHTTCKSCKKDIKIRSYANDRSDLSKEKGDTFMVDCDECGHKQKIHVNDVRALMNRNLIYVGVVISIIVSIIGIQFLGIIGTITFAIPMIIWKQQQSSVHSFNSYLSRRD